MSGFWRTTGNKGMCEMDEATLRFFEELAEHFIVDFEERCGVRIWSAEFVEVDTINDLLAKHIQLLRYYSIPDGGYELRIGGERVE